MWNSLSPLPSPFEGREEISGTRGLSSGFQTQDTRERRAEGREGVRMVVMSRPNLAHIPYLLTGLLCLTALDGCSDLHIAAGHGDIQWGQRLLTQGVKVDIRDPGGRTPLY
jgi:hypothetical protein